MGIINATKTLVGYTHTLGCQDTIQVKLAVTGAPSIVTNPKDIVLVLDRSGSMDGQPLDSLKLGASSFVDIIYNTTGGTGDQIAGGTKIAIVSFADDATLDVALTTDVTSLKAAITALTASGNTNHAAAFDEAKAVLSSAANPKVIVMFTDGQTTIGTPADVVAAADAAKADGSTIYCIGLGSVNQGTLESWASSAADVAIAPTPADLQNLFNQLAGNLSKPGATNIIIDEVINTANFTIVSVDSHTTGTVTPNADPTTGFIWSISQLGTTGTETAELLFTVKPSVSASGSFAVNYIVTYKDDEQNQVTFAAPPNVEVNCIPTPIIITEPCPTATPATIDECKDSGLIVIDNKNLESLGRILEVDVTIKNVCPGKRVAVGVLVNELDANKNEYKRGMKMLTIPAHNRSTCQDILVQCLKFVLPEDLDVSGGSTTSICNARTFNVRAISHYIDTDYDCCKRP